MTNYYVYLYTHKESQKQYVGKGRGDRFKAHRWPSSSSSYFGAAIRKYGVDAFELRFLATELTEREALDLEMHAIYVLECRAPNGFNLTDGGEGTSGRLKTAEEKANIGAKNRLWKRGPEVGRKISAALTGKPMSEELKQKMRGRKSTYKMTQEHYDKLAASRNGRKMSDYCRQRLLESNLGATRTDESRERMRQARLANVAEQNAAREAGVRSAWDLGLRGVTAISKHLKWPFMTTHQVMRRMGLPTRAKNSGQGADD